MPKDFAGYGLIFNLLNLFRMEFGAFFLKNVSCFSDGGTFDGTIFVLFWI